MWLYKTFDALTKDELYQILQIRAAVFVVEQNCAYQDIDSYDKQAIHLFLVDNTAIVAYARLFLPDSYYADFTAIGRVLIKESHRKTGLGHLLIHKAMAYLQENHPEYSIKIGAQVYLKNFYESHGFKQIDTEYIEDGIAHIHMVNQRG